MNIQMFINMMRVIKVQIFVTLILFCFFYTKQSAAKIVIDTGGQLSEKALSDNLKKQAKRLPFKELNLKIDVYTDDEWHGTGALFVAPEKEQPAKIILNPNEKLNSFVLEASLLHELIHVIHYRYRPHEKAWVKEGVSLLGEKIFNQRLHPSFVFASKQPRLSLTHIPNEHIVNNRNPEEEVFAAYGLTLQYFLFLYNNCGSIDWWANMIMDQSKKSGVDFIEEFLVKNFNKETHALCENFKTSFVAFNKARYAPKIWDRARYITPDTLKVSWLDSDPEETMAPYSAYAVRRACKNPQNKELNSSNCLVIKFAEDVEEYVI